MMGQFQQCKTKVKEQNKEVMDFKGENNGEILIVFGRSWNCFRSVTCIFYEASYFLSILTFLIFFL